MSTLIQTIRDRLNDSTETLTAIGKATGLNPTALSRFSSGARESMSLEAAAKLAEYLGLGLVPVEPRKKRCTTKNAANG